MKWFYMLLRFLISIPLKIIYPMKVVGKKRPMDKGRYITVSNHLRALDVPLIAINLKGFHHFIAKKELAKHGIVRAMGNGAGVIFVDRNKADLSAMKKMFRVLNNEGSISIFPEGTRNKTDDTVQDIKSGVVLIAAKTSSPIIPVVIHKRAKAFKRNYIYVAEPFSLDKSSLKNMEAATEIVAQQMVAAKDYIDDYVANKRWKEIKATRKEGKRAIKQAKRACKAVKVRE